MVSPRTDARICARETATPTSPPERQGTLLQRAGSNLGLQRAGTLPTNARDLRHAATMPITYDIGADRPFCCGLWKFQQLLGAVIGVFACVACWVFRPIQEYSAANDMLGIACLCGTFWVFEVIPIYITALFPMMLIPLCKITSSDIVAGAYWNTVQMLFIAMYLVDIALEEVQLPRRLTLKCLIYFGTVQPWALLLGTMAVCWFLSMFINTIAVTLMLTPFALGIMNATEENLRDNIIEAGEHDSDGSSECESVDDRGVKEVQLFARGLLLGIAYSSTAGGMATLTGSIPNRIMVGQDLFNQNISWIRWFVFAAPLSVCTCVLAYLITWTRYVRHVRKLSISKDILEMAHDDLVKEIGPISRDEILVGGAQIVQILGLILQPLVIGPNVTTAYGTALLSDASIAIIPAVALFFMPSSKRPGQAVLSWNAVHEKLDFGVLLLIGGGFAMSKGFSESGLDQVVGDWFADITKEMQSLMVTLVVLVMGSVGTQLFSAVGCATTFLPVLTSAATEVVINPLRLSLPGTISCSLAFMLPTATPANVVVLAKSQELPKSLRVRDFILTGLPLNLASIAICGVLVHVLGQSIFHTGDPFPASVCNGRDVNCIWLPIPGRVDGSVVHSQACMPVDLDKDTRCKIWNGTLVNVSDYSINPYSAPAPIPTEVDGPDSPGPVGSPVATSSPVDAIETIPLPVAAR